MDEVNVNEDFNSYITKKIDALNNKAWNIHITQPKEGLELSNQALTLSKKANYPSGIAYAIRNKGVSNRYLSNLEEALSLSLEAIHLFKELDDEHGLSQALVSTGAIYYYMGEYERGLDNFLQGLQHGELVGNKEAMTYAYNGAGYIYSLLGNHVKGLDFLHKALDLCKEIQNYNIESSTLESLAVVYLNDKQVDNAYKTYKACVELCEKHGEKRNLGYAFYGLGEIMIHQKEPQKAKEYFEKSLDIHSGISYKIGVARALLQLGILYKNGQQSFEAKKYLTRSLEVAESIKAKAVMFKVHQAFSDLFRSTRDFDLFIYHFELYHKFKSEVFKEEQESKQKYLTLQHELDKIKQESEISRLTNVVMKEKNAELEKKTVELEKSHNSISVLSKIGQDITSTLNLETILNTVYKNVNELMDATVFGIGIFNRDKNCIEYQMSIEKGKRYQPYQRTMEDKNQFPVWCIENKKEVFINDIHEEYSKYLPNKDLTILSSAAMEDGTLPESPNSLIYLPLMVKDDVIGLLSVQSYQKNAYTSYHLDILSTLASYTAAALFNAQSFEKLQHTIDELKVTQAQLIQQEKMASLGELTAGIAHEIQNPLNFVNNFSEVNAELLEELVEEIENQSWEEVKSIAADLKENETKISHHGKRADGIVKSMLQHSRNTQGDALETDINSLVDEYMRLAYHGMRAKDKSFNTELSTQLDDSIERITVVPQEIGRVLLNLFTNAFHAINKSKKEKPTEYKPKINIATTQSGGHIKIEITDNGSGIPADLKGKIFQPFFTTKPTGEGTGLGLSLSYDIIKTHGGTLEVESTPGEGSTFIITLPLKPTT